MLKSAINASNYEYVQGTTYGPVARVDVRTLAGGMLQTNYDYYLWTEANGQGRLERILTTNDADPVETLQDLRYTYDGVGNLLTIQDDVAGNPQTQTFTYDGADRLASAVASGGSGGTYALENYTYNGTTGNLASKAGVSYTYGDTAHKHAVTLTSNGNTYGYDANGNLTSRTVSDVEYTLTYEAENHLLQVEWEGNEATFVYDGDGKRVKATIGGVSTTYIGDYFEWSGSTSTMIKYFYAGGQRVAMKKGSTVYFLFADHLGSTAITTNSSGAKVGELRYKAWGENRYTWGTTYTQRRFTGQIDESSLGLYFLNARYYEGLLGRFIQADSVIPEPGNPQSLDRLAYVFNSPIKYTDPSGYIPCFEDGFCVYGSYSSSEHLKYLTRQYGIYFTGSWTESNRWSVIAGSQSVGGAYAGVTGSNAALAFRDVYGIRGSKRFTFEWGCSDCARLGRTAGTRHIKFRDFYSRDASANELLVVHELFHALENAMEMVGNDGRKHKPAREALPNRLWTTRDGLAGPFEKWQHSTDLSRGEVFADMGIGWVFNRWADPMTVELASVRQEWMSLNMPGYINFAINNQE